MKQAIDSKFWKTVIDTMQEGLVLVDPDGEIVFVNAALEALLGYRADELKGNNCEMFLCNRCFRTRGEGLEKYCALFNGARVESVECIYRKKDGSSVHILKNASVIRNDQGEVIGGVESLTDLTQFQAKEKEIENLRQRLHYDEGFQGIIGTSLGMRKVFDLASSAAQSDAPLIIYGESGTGKELLAAAVHQIGRRREAPFIKVNCAALNENLLESELFGHVKGAFTGAEYSRIGRFEAANGGSIFLDEIGDLPLTTQTKLLRVVQEQEIERVGDHRPLKVDVRILCATHKNLQALIQEGLFRDDLYYRIGVIPIHLPPLHERKGDIPLLIDSFIRRIGEKTGKPIEGISRDALDLMVHYHWPGNIRELINVIEYAFVLCPGRLICPSHLPAQFHESYSPPVSPTTEGPSRQGGQRERLIEALEATHGNQSQAAKLLGVSRVTIWKWMKKYGIERGARAYGIRDDGRNNLRSNP
ncbi:MAG: sigma 54-interacting transcriptional regulator [bacterium]|nr:sigma 54-interacting transcriptional regulator [bacterium]